MMEMQQLQGPPPSTAAVASPGVPKGYAEEMKAKAAKWAAQLSGPSDPAGELAQLLAPAETTTQAPGAGAADAGRAPASDLPTEKAAASGDPKAEADPGGGGDQSQTAAEPAGETPAQSAPSWPRAPEPLQGEALRISEDVAGFRSRFHQREVRFGWIWLTRAGVLLWDRQRECSFCEGRQRQG